MIITITPYNEILFTTPPDGDERNFVFKGVKNLAIGPECRAFGGTNIFPSVAIGNGRIALNGQQNIDYSFPVYEFIDKWYIKQLQYNLVPNYNNLNLTAFGKGKYRNKEYSFGYSTPSIINNRTPKEKFEYAMKMIK